MKLEEMEKRKTFKRNTESLLVILLEKKERRHFFEKVIVSLKDKRF